MNDRIKEIIAEISSELDKSLEKQLWSTSDNKVFPPEEYTKALQEIISKYTPAHAIIVCDETNNTPEDAAKGVINVTIQLPPHLKKIALDGLGLAYED